MHSSYDDRWIWNFDLDIFSMGTGEQGIARLNDEAAVFDTPLWTLFS